MKVLLAESDPTLRDQICIGLEAFGDLEVDQAGGVRALDKVRNTEYSFVIIGIESAASEGRDLFERLRVEAPELEVLIAAPEAVANQLREEKVRGRIYGFLHCPLAPVEFFRTVSRLRQRRESAAGRTGP